MAHREVVAPDDTHVGDGFAVFIQSLDGCDDVVEMLLRETAAVDGEAHDVGQFCLLLRGLEVVFHGIVAQLGDADAVAADQFEREAFARKGLVAALAIELPQKATSVTGPQVCRKLETDCIACTTPS